MGLKCGSTNEVFSIEYLDMITTLPIRAEGSPGLRNHTNHLFLSSTNQDRQKDSAG